MTSRTDFIDDFLRASCARESQVVSSLLQSAGKAENTAEGKSSLPSQKELLNARDKLSGGTALHLAIKGNKFGVDNAPAADKAASSRQDPSSSSDSNNIRLLETAEVLITAGLSLEALDNWGASALVLALNLRQRVLVDRLYKAGANLHYKLHWAAEQGYEDVARELLASGASVDLLDDKRQTPLMRACRRGHAGLVQVLLEAQADITLEVQGRKPLWVASCLGHSEVVRLLLAAGAEVCFQGKDRSAADQDGAISSSKNKGRDVGERAANFKNQKGSSASTSKEAAESNGDVDDEEDDPFDREGSSPLHVASLSGSVATVQLLLDAKAHVNDCDSAGCTALHLATGKGHLEVMQMLLSTIGVQVDKIDVRGRTALVLAVLKKNMRAVKVLQSAGANMGFKLHYAAKYGDVQLCKSMANEGADLHLKEGEQGWTALHVAAVNGQDLMISALLDSGARINQQSVDGVTSLMLAAGHGHVYALKALLGGGAGTGIMDIKSRTALHHASEAGHDICVAELLDELDQRHKRVEKAAAVAAASAQSAAQAAARGEREAASQLIAEESKATILDRSLEEGPESSAGSAGVSVSSHPYHPATTSNIIPPSYLLTSTASFNAEAHSHHSSLSVTSSDISHLASTAAKAYLDAAKAASQAAALTVEASADLINSRDVDGRTAIAMAASNGHYKVVQLLLNVKANIYLSDLAMECPLHMAAAGGHLEVVQELVAWGAAINVQNKEGMTPLHHACAEGRSQIVEYLLSAGARSDLRTVNNKHNDESVTPFLIAASSGQAEVVELLLKRSSTPSELIREADGSGQTALGRCIQRCPASLEGKPEGQKGLKVASILIAAGSDINYTPPGTGAPTIQSAAASSTTEMVKLLLESGADLTIKSKNNRHALLAAAKKGKTVMCRMFLERYPAAIHFQDDQGMTPLLESVGIQSKLDTAKYLLDEGADPTQVNSVTGDSVLTTVAACGRQDCVQLLLQDGRVDPGHRNKAGLTAVHVAAATGHIEVLKMFLQDKTRDMKLQLTSLGRTALHMAAGSGQPESTKLLLDGLLEGESESVGAGMDPNQPSVQPKGGPGKDNLHSYAFTRMCSRFTTPKEGCLQYVSPAAVNSTDERNSTFINTHLNNIGSMALADIPKRSFSYMEVNIVQGRRPANVAIGIAEDLGKYAIFPGLLTFITFKTHCMLGTSGNHCTGNSDQNEQYGFKFGQGDVVGVVVNRAYGTVSFTLNGTHLGVSSRGVDFSQMHFFVAVAEKPSSKAEVTRLEVNFGQKPFLFDMDDLLIQEEGRLNPGNSEPWRCKEQIYPLHMAACSKSRQTLELLLSHHARPEQPDANAWLALHFAALNGWSDGITMIMDLPGAAKLIDAKSVHGSTALQLAVKSSHADASRVLLKYGANHMVLDRKQRTLLMFAAEQGNTELINMLIDKGIPIKAKDHMGRTALQYACNEATIAQLEDALNQVRLYHKVFEISMQADSKWGAQGQVIMAKHTATGNTVAIKFHKNADVRNYSAEIIQSLDHKFVAGIPPGIAAGDWLFDDPDKYPLNPFALVMDGGDVDLQVVLDEQGSKPLPENQCRFIFECIVQAVEHVHSHDLVHHDIKAKNLVRFFDGRYRLIDFDNARERDKAPFGNTSIDICAPEIAQALLHKQRTISRPEMDMWSVGCILYQLIMQRYLLADLAELKDLPWKDDIFARAFNDGPLQVWSDLDQQSLDQLLLDRMSKRRHIRLADHAYSLLGHLLQVDPRKRFTIDDVMNHAFLRGGNTKTMDDESLQGIRSKVDILNTKMDTVVTHVISINERTLKLADLPQQVQSAFEEVSKKISGVRKLMTNLATADECPSIFVIVPDMSLKDMCSSTTSPESMLSNGANKIIGAISSNAEETLMSWTSALQDIFTGQLSLMEVTKRFVHKRYRLKLVCESCMTPCGDGYVIEKAMEWTAKLMPAVKASFAIAKSLNLMAGIAKFVFPGVPVIPDNVMDSCRSMINVLQAKSSAEDFACIQDSLEDEKSDLHPKKQVHVAVRQLHAFLVKEDPCRTWASLARVHIETEDRMMWVCPSCLVNLPGCGQSSSSSMTTGGIVKSSTVPREEYDRLKKEYEEERAKLLLEIKQLKGNQGRHAHDGSVGSSTSSLVSSGSGCFGRGSSRVVSFDSNRVYPSASK